MCKRVLDLTKPVRTRDGRAARILATDVHDNRYPVVAAVEQENGDEVIEGYTADGNYLDGEKEVHSKDLVNVPQPLYLNVYRDGDAGAHTSRAAADAIASIHRIACVKVEYREGQFDE